MIVTFTSPEGLENSNRLSVQWNSAGKSVSLGTHGFAVCTAYTNGSGEFPLLPWEVSPFVGDVQKYPPLWHFPSAGKGLLLPFFVPRRSSFLLSIKSHPLSSADDNLVAVITAALDCYFRGGPEYRHSSSSCHAGKCIILIDTSSGFVLKCSLPLPTYWESYQLTRCLSINLSFRPIYQRNMSAFILTSLLFKLVIAQKYGFVCERDGVSRPLNCQHSTNLMWEADKQGVKFDTSFVTLVSLVDN